MNITIINCKIIFVYKNEIKRIQKKIKNFQIILNEIIVIITFNNIEFDFEFYLIIVNDKTKIENKLFNFNTFLKVLQKKKRFVYSM